MPEKPYAKPTDPTAWATGGTRTEPGAGKRIAGWLLNEVPPFDFFNQIQGVSGDYLAWLAANATRTFDNFYDAVAATVPGDVFRHHPASPPATFDDGTTAINVGPDTAFRIQCDGRRLYRIDRSNSVIEAYGNDPALVGGATLWSTPQATTPNSSHTDGSVLAVASVTGGGIPEVAILDAVTGAVLFAPGPVFGFDVHSVYCDSKGGVKRAYWDFILSIEQWDSVSGVQSTFAVRPFTVHAVAASNDAVYSFERSGAGPTGMQLVRIAKTSGLAQIIASFPGLTQVGSFASMTTDGQALYFAVYHETVAMKPIVGRIPLSPVGVTFLAGVSSWVVELATTLAPPFTIAEGDIVVDDRFVYVKGEQEVQVLDKTTGAPVFSLFGLYQNLDCDGLNLWLTELGGGNDDILHIGTGRSPGVWLRGGDGSGGGLNNAYGPARRPWPKLALPLSGGI